MTQVEQDDQPVDPQGERRAGRPRSEDADRAIIEATLDLLAEVGIAPLSIEQVASQAGVGKATVYRRWPNKDALIVDAMATLKGPVPPLPGISLREDLTILLTGDTPTREAVRRRRLYTSFVGEMGRYPDLTQRFVECVIEPRRAATRESIIRAVARGELRGDLEIELLQHLILSPVLQWTMHHTESPLDPEHMNRMLDALLEGLAPHG